MKFLQYDLNVLTEVYERAGTVRTSKGKFTTINELTDQAPAVRPTVLTSAISVLMGMRSVSPEVNKVLSEEDKGAILAGLVSVHTFLPLAMARHDVPYDIPGALVVPLSMEYADSRLTVNGLEEGDKLMIVDDTLASGGTMLALIHAARRMGCEIVDVRVVVEKLGYGGRARLSNYGVEVRAGIGIEISEEGVVSVTEHLECPR